MRDLCSKTMSYDPPLVHLPGTPLTPEVVLHRTLNKIKSIKSVTVIIRWTDDSVDTDHSLQTSQELAAAAYAVDELARDALFGRVNATLKTPPGSSA